MLLSVLGGEDMIGALTALEAVAHERQQRVVLLLWRTEKGADMPIATEHRAGKGNGCRGRLHGVFLPKAALFRKSSRYSASMRYIVPQSARVPIRDISGGVTALRAPAWSL